MVLPTFHTKNFLLLVRDLKFYEELDRQRLSYLSLFIFDQPIEPVKIDELSSALVENFGGKKQNQGDFHIISSRKNIVFLWPYQGQQKELVIIVRPNTIIYKKIQRALLAILLGLIVAAIIVAGIVAYLLWTEYFEWALFRSLFSLATKIAAYTLGAFIAALALTMFLSSDIDRRFIQGINRTKDIVLSVVGKVFGGKYEKIETLPDVLREKLTDIKAKHLVTLAQMTRVRFPGL